MGYSEEERYDGGKIQNGGRRKGSLPLLLRQDQEAGREGIQRPDEPLKADRGTGSPQRPSGRGRPQRLPACSFLPERG